MFVAQGLAQEADVLLLDEPVAGLDLPSADRIRSVVAAERDAGRTVLIATHDLDEAARADEVVLLAGQVVAAGARRAVLDGGPPAPRLRVAACSTSATASSPSTTAPTATTARTRRTECCDGAKLGGAVPAATEEVDGVVAGHEPGLVSDGRNVRPRDRSRRSSNVTSLTEPHDSQIRWWWWRVSSSANS